MLRFPDRLQEPCRVFCIGRNYADHIREMGSPPEDQCVVFMKPATSLVPTGQVVRLPRGRGPVHHEVELVAAIGSGGRDIPAARAREHVAGVTLGLDLTLRDLQARFKEKGQPWELSKAFEQSAPIGDFRPLSPEIDLGDLDLCCRVNGEVRQQGNTRDMLFPVERLIEILSQTWALREGDVIFTGTPAGVGPVAQGDRVEVESPRLGSFSWTFV